MPFVEPDLALSQTQIGLLAAGLSFSWAIAAFFVQLALNGLWSFAFFGARSPLAGLVVIAALIVAIAATISAFWRLDRTAALLLVPYLAWVAYAALLNGTIWRMNG